MTKRFLTILTVLCLSACSDEKERRLENQVAALSNQVAALENHFDALSNQVVNVRAEIPDDIKFAEDVLKEEIASARHDSLEWDLSDKGAYESGPLRIDSDNGSFLVSCEAVTPYLDGYKVRLSVGNPSSAIFRGFDWEVEWGGAKPWVVDGLARPPAPGDIDKWWKSLRPKKYVRFTEELRPGSWNTVEMVLSPAKPGELGYLAVRYMVTRDISLLKPQPAGE